MAIKGRENMEALIYDTVENGRPTKKIALKHAEVLGGTFTDFIGKLNDRGTLVRKITIAVPPAVADYISENGVPLGRWIPQGTPEDEMDDYDPILSIKINYSYTKPPKIEVKVGENGRAKQVPEGAVHELQTERFDDALIVGRIVNGTMMNRPYTTVYLDHASFTIHKDEKPKFEEDMLEEYGSTFLGTLDDGLPEEEMPFEE